MDPLPSYPPPPQYNGRVANLDPNAQRGFNLTPPKQDTLFETDAIKGIHQQTDLSRIFFGPQNIKALQEGIRYSVYVRSCKKHIIDYQSEEELKIVMRSMYLQHAEHKPVNTLEQVRILNTHVLGYCVPRIVNEITGYLKFRQEISQLPVPMSRGENVNVKGTKVLEMQNF